MGTMLLVLQGRKENDGEDGVDGVGLEFVYAITNNDTIAEGSRPSNAWGYATGGTSQAIEWETEISGLTNDVTRLFSSHRAVSGAPDVGSTVDGDWSLPALIGNIASNGTDGTNGTDLSAPERVVLFDALQIITTYGEEIEFTTQIPDREGTLLISGWGGAFQVSFDAKATLAATGAILNVYTNPSVSSNTSHSSENFAASAATALSAAAGRVMYLHSITRDGFTASVNGGVFSPPPVPSTDNQDGNDEREKLTITFIPD